MRKTSLEILSGAVGALLLVSIATCAAAGAATGLTVAERWLVCPAVCATWASSSCSSRLTTSGSMGDTARDFSFLLRTG
eukprot:25449-Eustigmatos_ZCMA.PRE.1